MTQCSPFQRERLQCKGRIGRVSGKVQRQGALFRSVSLLVCQSVSHSLSLSVCQSVSQSVCQCVSKSVSQSVSQSVGMSVSRYVSPLVGQPVGRSEQMNGNPKKIKINFALRCTKCQNAWPVTTFRLKLKLKMKTAKIICSPS